MNGSTHATRSAPRTARPERARWGALLIAVLTVVCAAGISACASGDEAAPGPLSSLEAQSETDAAREVVVAYLDMLERGEFGELDRVATPRYAGIHAGGADKPLARVRLVDLTLQPEPGGDRTQARMTVYIDPGSAAGPWGAEPGERVLFAYLVRSADGGWLIDDFGTGP